MKFGISQSQLTNNIYVGRLNKKGNEYLEKQDMTIEAIRAVIEHIRYIQEDEGNNTISLSNNKIKYSLILTTDEMQ